MFECKMRVARAALMACLLPGCTSGLESVSAVMTATGNLGPVSSQPEDHAVCPSSVIGAMGSACDVEGLLCYPEYTCGIAPVIATCQCAGGQFACVDTLGNPLLEDAAPACPASLPTPACPATMTLASNTACTQAGQLCTYASPCSGSIPAFLDCQCVALTQIDGGVYLGYSCETCTPGAAAAPADDSGATPADAEAPVEGSTAPDAAADATTDATPKDASGD
jgi:hypothetical protein